MLCYCSSRTCFIHDEIAQEARAQKRATSADGDGGKEEKREPTTKRFKVQDLRQNSCEELPLIQWVISIKFHLIPALLFRLDESEIVEIPSDAIRLHVALVNFCWSTVRVFNYVAIMLALLNMLRF